MRQNIKYTVFVLFSIEYTVCQRISKLFYLRLTQHPNFFLEMDLYNQRLSYDMISPWTEVWLQQAKPVLMFKLLF